MFLENYRSLAIKVMVKNSINRNFTLEIQIFIFFLAIITPFFDTNLPILILYSMPQGQWLTFSKNYL